MMNFASIHIHIHIRFSTSIGIRTSTGTGSIIGACIGTGTEYAGNPGFGSVSVQTFIRTWLCLETVFASQCCFTVLDSCFAWFRGRAGKGIRDWGTAKRALTGFLIGQAQAVISRLLR